MHWTYCHIEYRVICPTVNNRTIILIKFEKKLLTMFKVTDSQNVF